MSILKEKYKKEVVKAMKATGRFPSTMDVPKLSKVVVNIAVNAQVDRDTLKVAAEDLAKITGQRPASARTRRASRSRASSNAALAGSRFPAAARATAWA